MELLHIFTASFVVGLSGAMAPGPMLAATISHSARRGFWAGPLIVLGHAVPEVIVLVGIGYGLAEFLNSDLAKAVISLAGGAVLLFMGGSLLWNLRRLSLDLTKESASSATGAVGAGAMTSLSNPYWSIWWAGPGIALYFKLVGDGGLTGAATFFTGHISADLAWFCLVSFLVGCGRGLMTDMVYRGLMGVCGVTLAGYGVWIGSSGYTALRCL